MSIYIYMYVHVYLFGLAKESEKKRLKKELGNVVAVDVCTCFVRDWQLTFFYFFSSFSFC